MSTRSDTELFTEENYFTNCDDINWLIGLFLQKRTPEPPWVP